MERQTGHRVEDSCKTDMNSVGLTISVRQAGVPAQRTMTLEDDRPLHRHASGDSNVKFKKKC